MSKPPASRSSQVSHLLIGSMALQGANLVIFVMLARWLSLNDFGVYRLLFLIHQLLTGFFFAAIPTSLLYFCGRALESERGVIVRRHLVLVLIVCVIAILFLAFGGNLAAILLSNPGIEDLLWLFSPYPAAYMLYSMVSPCLVSYGRSSLSSIFSVLLALLNAVPVLIAASGGADLPTIVITASLSATIGAIIALVVIFRVTRNNVPAACSVTKGQILTYLWPLLGAGGVGLLGLRMDQVVVSKMLGPESYGLYVVGAFEIPIFGMLQSSVSAVLLPKFAQLARLQAWDEIAALWRKALIRSAIIVYPIAASLFVLAENFIRYLFGEKYQQATLIFQLYLLLAPIRIMTFGLVLRACGHTRPDLLGAFAYLVSVTVGAMLGVLTLGAPGAMLAVVLCTVGLAAWLVRQTTIATAGSISAREMYPVSVIVTFPALLLLFWILIHEVIGKLISLSDLALLSLGGGGAFVLAVMGLVTLHMYSKNN